MGAFFHLMIASLKIPDFLVNPVVNERLAGAVGTLPFTPFRAGSGESGKGKAAPLERRRGRNSPPANPEWVTAGASERMRNGVPRVKSKKRSNIHVFTSTHHVKLRKLQMALRLTRIGKTEIIERVEDSTLDRECLWK